MDEPLLLSPSAGGGGRGALDATIITGIKVGAIQNFCVSRLVVDGIEFQWQYIEPIKGCRWLVQKYGGTRIIA